MKATANPSLIKISPTSRPFAWGISNLGTEPQLWRRVEWECPSPPFSIDDVAVAQKATPSTTGARGKGTNEKASAGCQGVGGGGRGPACPALNMVAGRQDTRGQFLDADP